MWGPHTMEGILGDCVGAVTTYHGGYMGDCVGYYCRAS